MSNNSKPFFNKTLNLCTSCCAIHLKKNQSKIGMLRIYMNVFMHVMPLTLKIGYQSCEATNSSSKKSRINIFIVIDNALHDLNIDNMYTSTIICTNESPCEKISTPCLLKLNLFMFGFEKVSYKRWIGFLNIISMWQSQCPKYDRFLSSMARWWILVH